MHESEVVSRGTRMYVGARVIREVKEHGRSRAQVACGRCSTVQVVYYWSLSGRGKKCTGCGFFLEIRKKGAA